MHMLCSSRRAQGRERGFTIVELLIVIVVIAILASISIVAYVGVQDRANDALRHSAARQVSKGLDMYFVANGEYPRVCWDYTDLNNPSTRYVVNNTGEGYHCAIERLAPVLVPDYISDIPDVTSLPEGEQVFYTTGVYVHEPRDAYVLGIGHDDARTSECIYRGGNPKSLPGAFNTSTLC